MRIGSHVAKLLDRVGGSPSRKEIQLRERALSMYSEASTTLTNRELCPAVWDSVNMELAKCYFAAVQQLEEEPGRDEQELTTVLMKALRHYEAEWRTALQFDAANTERVDESRVRVAGILHRLGAAHTRLSKVTRQLEVNLRLAEMYYERALDLYGQHPAIGDWDPVVILQARVELGSLFLRMSASSVATLKGLRVLLNCSPLFRLCIPLFSDGSRDTSSIDAIMSDFERQASTLLQHLCKSVVGDEQAAQRYKDMYLVLLRVVTRYAVGSIGTVIWLEQLADLTRDLLARLP